MEAQKSFLFLIILAIVFAVYSGLSAISSWASNSTALRDPSIDQKSEFVKMFAYIDMPIVKLVLSVVFGVIVAAGGFLIYKHVPTAPLTAAKAAFKHFEFI